ncbi:MAG: hypothetical protein C4576_23780 [Desulfobacteraceae bacterium]|nr:MAG: hypothetical protein C4576_23780 [Desulfobacteraceae bacterium]
MSSKPEIGDQRSEIGEQRKNLRSEVGEQRQAPPLISDLCYLTFRMKLATSGDKRALWIPD